MNLSAIRFSTGRQFAVRSCCHRPADITSAQAGWMHLVTLAVPPRPTVGRGAPQTFNVHLSTRTGQNRRLPVPVLEVLV